MMTWKPHLTVAAVIERDGQFLMVKERSDNLTVYNQPAGHVENEETIFDAIVREVNEETAWHFTPEYIVGLYKWRKADIDRTFVRICYSGTVKDHNALQQLDDGILSANWMTIEELMNMDTQKMRSPMVRQCINDYGKGSQFPLDFITEW